MRCSFVSPRDHIWSQWTFVRTTAAVSVASPTFSLPLTVKTQKTHTQKQERIHMFCNIISSLSEYLLSQNVVKNCINPLMCPMPNIFFFLSYPDGKFPLRTQLCQQQAAICSKVRTPSKKRRKKKHIVASMCRSLIPVPSQMTVAIK